MAYIIYSRIDGQPLARVIRAHEVTELRQEESNPGVILQVCAKHLPAGMAFAPHAHRPTARATTGTQEAWVVISGRVSAKVYDLDDSLVAQVGLGAGDCLVLLRGGHELTVAEDTVLYEFKNGPYLGREADKRSLA